jgi:hypothetical protein
VQLSLDNFFSGQSSQGKKAEEVALPTPVTSTLSDIILDDDDGDLGSDLDEIDLPPPKKKLKKPIIVSEKSKPRARPTVQRKIITSTNGSTRTRQAADQSDLPPMSDIPAMFDDLVSRADRLGSIVDRLNGRKLRVATMCSGTESPLLALRMITRSLLKETGKQLEIEHIFSCEIEPFKQAYIERNFAPPILFRDVLELENDYAYGPNQRTPLTYL